MSEPKLDLDQANATLINIYCPLWTGIYHRLVKGGVPERHAVTMVCAYIDVSLMSQSERSVNPLDIDDLFDEDGKTPPGPFPNGE